METRKIHDNSGEWLVNTCQYTFVDPTTGCRFEPGVPTKALRSDWVKGQGVIKPFVVEAKAETTKVAPESPAVAPDPKKK